MEQAGIKSITPILIVETIEPCLSFWVDRLGFALTTTVPEAGPFDFVIVQRGGVSVMLQSARSASQDLATAAPTPGQAALYVGVPAIDALLPALAGAPIAVARRETFYGADEIWVRDPAGNLIGFAAEIRN